MKQKKLVYYFLILSISLTLLLPILNLSFSNNYKKINLQSFSKQQLFSTDIIESIKNYFVYKTFNISLNESKVIAGNDNFFFLGNGFGRIIDKVKGNFPYTNKDIDAWTTKLNKLQNWYKKQGIQFIFVVASNKHTVYSDKLPNSIRYKEEGTITNDLAKSSLDKNIHILDLKKALRKKAQEKQLYFRTDTHWNHYGALIGYINTMQYLNTIYMKSYKIPEYTMIETTTSAGGDLTNFLKINHFLASNHEKDYNLTFKRQSKECYGKITESSKLEKCTPGIKNTFNQYSIHESSSNKEKLLYVCDSFGLANSQLYEKTFNTVWRLHIQYIEHINGDLLASFIQKHKPDVVIYQIVERDLNNYHYNAPHK